MELDFTELKDFMDVIIGQLEGGDAEGVLSGLRFLRDLVAMFEGPFDLDPAAFMAGALGLPLAGVGGVNEP